MNTRSINAELDELYGKNSTPEREAFRKEAYIYLTKYNILYPVNKNII